MKKLITVKNNLKESIPLIALMCAISAIMVIFVTYLPVSSIIFTLLLPLPSIIVSLYTKSKFYFIYLFSTLSLSLIVGAGDIAYALSSIIPSLLLGFIIGILIKNNFSIGYVFLITSIVSFFLNLLSLCILNFLFNIDLINIINDLLNFTFLKDESYLTLLFIYIYSLIESFLIILVSLDQIKFLIKDSNVSLNKILIEIITSIVLSILGIILMLTNIQFGYVFLAISFVSLEFLFTLPAKTLQKSIFILIIGLLGWIIYTLALPYFELKNSFIILEIIPSLLSIISLIYIIIKMLKSKSHD